jgi:hypothetical protein
MNVTVYSSPSWTEYCPRTDSGSSTTISEVDTLRASVGRGKSHRFSKTCHNLENGRVGVFLIRARASHTYRGRANRRRLLPLERRAGQERRSLESRYSDFSFRRTNCSSR